MCRFYFNSKGGATFQEGGAAGFGGEGLHAQEGGAADQEGRAIERPVGREGGAVGWEGGAIEGLT